MAGTGLHAMRSPEHARMAGLMGRNTGLYVRMRVGAPKARGGI